MKEINIGLMRSLLRYDPSVGGSCLVWLVNRKRIKAGTPAGSIDRKGYMCVKVNGGTYKAHRLVWAIVKGESPPCQIDHINGVEMGNSIENLRLALKNDYDNQQNLKRRKNNTSGYIGVNWHRPSKKWKAQIGVNGSKKHLGLFATPEEAHIAYLAAKKELHKFQPIPREDNEIL